MILFTPNFEVQERILYEANYTFQDIFNDLEQHCHIDISIVGGILLFDGTPLLFCTMNEILMTMES